MSEFFNVGRNREEKEKNNVEAGNPTSHISKPAHTQNTHIIDCNYRVLQFLRPSLFISNVRGSCTASQRIHK